MMEQPSEAERFIGQLQRCVDAWPHADAVDITWCLMNAAAKQIASIPDEAERTKVLALAQAHLGSMVEAMVEVLK